MSASSHLETKIKSFTTALKRRQVEGSYNVAKETAEIIRLEISKAVRFTNLNEVINTVKHTGRRLVQAQPLEFAIGNIVRRILYIIREEYHAEQLQLTSPSNKTSSSSLPLSASSNTATTPTHSDQEDGSGDDDEEEELGGGSGIGGGLSSSSVLTSSAVHVMQSFPALYMLGGDTTYQEYNQPIENHRELKNAILASITELIDELQNIYRNVADQAIEHIHANEVILTYGGSRTVEEFLKAAGKKRKFEVICVESVPLGYRGQNLAVSLANSGQGNIQTTLIPDAAVFAMMARVNKVIIGTHAVMANGGLIAPSGTHMIALAAKHHKVPLVVCTGLYKLSPLYPYDQDTFNDLKSPSNVFKFEQANSLEHVHVINPAYDYIPAELISLYITNFGGHNPSYIYRLLAEYYNPEDYTLGEDDDTATNTK